MRQLLCGKSSTPLGLSSSFQVFAHHMLFSHSYSIITQVSIFLGGAAEAREQSTGAIQAQHNDACFQF